MKWLVMITVWAFAGGGVLSVLSMQDRAEALQERDALQRELDVRNARLYEAEHLLDSCIDQYADAARLEAVCERRLAHCMGVR